MDQIKREREALDLRTTELQQRRRAYYQETGETFYAAPAAEEETPSCASLREAILAGEEEIRRNEELRKELEQLAAEAEEAEQVQKEQHQGLRDMKKDNLGFFENIGRAGFQAFREGTLQGEGLDTLFAPLLEQKEKINTYEVELKGGKPPNDSFFNKIARRSREVYLRSNQSLGIRNMTKAYQKAGEQLTEMEDLAYQGIEPLERAFAPYVQNRVAVETLEGAVAKGKARETELAEALKSRDAHRNPRRRISDLEKEAEILEKRRLDLVSDFGAACEALPGAAERLSPELAAKGEELTREELWIQEERGRLERARRRLDLSESLQKRESEKGSLVKTLERNQRELSNLEEEIRRIQGELDALKEDPKS